MAMMKVTFPGGAAVDAHCKGHTIHTDQPEKNGGDDTGPQPFDLFLASIATCAGFYALRFCEKRGYPAEELAVTLEPVRDPESSRVATIRIEVHLPQGFPEKYHAAVLRAIDQCAVKRHIINPPDFDVQIAGPDA
jgi:ribosomal protein S12 methylthiotransferase accessory factor